MRSLIAISVFALVGAVGCGGTDLGGDDFGTNEGPDLAGAHLQSGTYTVSNIVKKSDGCGLMLEGAGNFPSTQVTNTQTMLSIGSQCTPTQGPSGLTCNPGGYLEGTGPYTTSSTATLTFNTTATLPDGCTYMKMVTTNVTFTGMNHLSVDYTDTESSYAASCPAADQPAMDPCTSEYTFDLTM